MRFDGDQDSGRISPAVVILIILGVAIIGFIWWMNKSGAGGAPEPAKLPTRSNTQPYIPPQQVPEEKRLPQGR